MRPFARVHLMQEVRSSGKPSAGASLFRLCRGQIPCWREIFRDTTYFVWAWGTIVMAAERSGIEGDGSGLVSALLISGAILVVAILALILSAVIAVEHEITKHVIRDVGIALVVSAVIILTIEAKSRAELNRMVARFLRRTHENLFQTILGVEFPKTMFDFVRDRLMKEPIFRTGTEVHYTIRPLEENAGERFGIKTIILDVTFSYTIKNLSDREQKHPLRYFVEEPLDHVGPNELKIPKLIVDGVEVSETDLRHADGNWRDRPGLRRFEYDIKMAPKEERTVEMHHTTIKLLADTEPWRCLHPCDGLRLSITHPAELAVMIDAMHPDDLETIQENEVSYIGKISRPLFPANGFLFWWHPRQPIPQTGVNPVETQGGEAD